MERFFDSKQRRAVINSGAQSGIHVSNQRIVDIYTAFRHMWGDSASGSPVVGSYLRRDEADLV
jgi:hypothetical protein